MPKQPAIDTALYKAFGRRLRFLRKLENLTQEELAEAASISYEHLNKLERGASGPSFAVICSLAQALQTEPANLFLFPKPKNNQSGQHEEDESYTGEARQDWTQYITHVGLWEVDLVTGNTDWSQAMLNLLGYSRRHEVKPSMDLFLEKHVSDHERERLEKVLEDTSLLMDENALPDLEPESSDCPGEDDQSTGGGESWN